MSEPLPRGSVIVETVRKFTPDQQKLRAHILAEIDALKKEFLRQAAPKLRQLAMLEAQAEMYHIVRPE